MPSHKPLRVVFVDVPLMYSSGITQVLYKLARFKKSELLDMSIASLDTPQKSMVESLKATGVEVKHVGNASILSAALKLRAYIAASSVDLVVANSFRSYLVAKLAVLGSEKPVIFWIHTINQILVSRIRKILFIQLTKNDPLLYVSHAVCENNRPAGHRGQDMVIYNAVEPPETAADWQPYGPEKRAELGIPPDATVLGYTANFAYYKDHSTLLNAFDALSQQNPKLHLILVGTGRTYDAAYALASRFSAKDRIHFLGSRRDARALLGLVDVYVHVSPEEAFGLAVVEAMLANRPVVAARAHALPELIRHGETGLLFEPRDVQDLQRQITAMLADPVLAARLAEAGEQDCRRRFPPEPFAQHVTDFLQGVVATRSLQHVMGEPI